MLPGMGGLEFVVIALAALVIVGPKDLPVLMRRVGKVVAKVRNMAQEFRASFDELARQSELDELRQEVEALRNTQQHYMRPLGEDLESHFREIGADLRDTPLTSLPPPTVSIEPPATIAAKPRSTIRKAAKAGTPKPKARAPKPTARPAARVNASIPKGVVAKAAPKPASKSVASTSKAASAPRKAARAPMRKTSVRKTKA